MAISGESTLTVNAADPEMPATVRGLLKLGLEVAAEGVEGACLAGRCGMIRRMVRLLAPVPDPQKIICIGLNYRDHAAESGVARAG